MEAIIRVPQRDAYGYVELKVEVKTAKEAIEIYKDAIIKSKVTKEEASLEDF